MSIDVRVSNIKDVLVIGPGTFNMFEYNTGTPFILRNVTPSMMTSLEESAYDFLVLDNFPYPAEEMFLHYISITGRTPSTNGGSSEPIEVPTYTDLLAYDTTTLKNGTMVEVDDASGDPNITSGRGIYTFVDGDWYLLNSVSVPGSVTLDWAALNDAPAKADVEAAINNLRTSTVRAAAGEAISTGDVVAIKDTDGKIYKASNTDVTMAYTVLGIAAGDYASGEIVTYIDRGVYEDTTGSFSGKYYVTIAGEMTNDYMTAMAGASFVGMVGVAISPTKIFVNVQPPFII